MASGAAAALGTLMKLKGAVKIRIGNTRVTGFLSRDESSFSPIAGRLLQGASQIILVPKSQHPSRPTDNATVEIDGDQLGGGRLTVLEVVDRDGYWNVLAGAELA